MAQDNLSLNFFPNLNLPILKNDNSSPTERDAVEKMMDKYQKMYPNWHVLDIYNLDLQNKSSTYMPERTYWDHIRAGKTSMPSGKDKWLLVENIEKPERKNSYPDSPLIDALGLDSRYVSWNKITQSLQSNRFKRWSQKHYMTDKLLWRLPTLLELNIIANRQMRQNPSSVYEWTSTSLQHPKISTSELIINYYQAGGAHTKTGGEWISGWSPAMIDHDPPTYISSFGGVGFRLVAEVI